jgi:hypothetical protein
MEGGGSYNLHAKIPAGGGNLALPFLEDAVRRLTLDDKPVVIADYGSSQGKNSLAPMRSAIKGLRARAGADCPTGHIEAQASTGEVRAAFHQQAADDWKSSLSLRAQELRPGGHLVVVLPGLSDDGGTGFEPLFAHANNVLAEMVSHGSLTAEERARMVLGAYPRRRSQLLEPFTTENQYCGLTVERCELSPLPDAAWNDFEKGRQEGNAYRTTCGILPLYLRAVAGDSSGTQRKKSVVCGRIRAEAYKKKIVEFCRDRAACSSRRNSRPLQKEAYSSP